MSVLLKVADAAAASRSPRCLPPRTEPPMASIRPTPNRSVMIGMMRLTAASAATPT